MKKIISLVLLLSLCLGLFAGCDLTQFIPGMQPNAPASNLENAKSLVFNTYKPANKDEIPVKSSDFEVMTSVLVDGETFPVAWTVEITAGAADAVKIVDGSSAAFKKVDLTEKPEEEVQFTLTATISDAEGNTETVSFKYKTLKFEAPAADKIVLKNENTYVTGTEYEYTSSSGSKKMEVVLKETKADALAFTMITHDDGSVSFKTDDGYFLYADGTHAKFVKEESDNTKFVLSAVEGGYTIKCFAAIVKEKPQYLEIYSGYLTCYGMDESKLNIYTFALEAAEGANGKVVKYSAGETPDDGGDEPEITFGPAADAVVPVAGTAYKLGLVQNKKGATYYISGGMSGFYMATNEAAASGLDAYIEAVDGGYNLYVMDNGAKKYINLATSVDSKDPNKIHINAVYGDTATTVYTYDETLKTLKATNDGTEYILGTRNDNTYTTVGFCKVSDKPFYCQFFAVSENENPGTGENPGENENPGTEVPSNGPFELNGTSLGLSDTYKADTAVIGGMTFGYDELYFAENGIQMRNKNDKHTAIWNAAAFGSAIEKIELVFNANKKTYSNTNAFYFTFGTAADALTTTVGFSTVENQKTYTVTPGEGNFTFFKMEYNTDYTFTFYIDSITIYLADGTTEGTQPENPGTEPENPGTEPENPGTEPENPGTETPDNNGGTVSVTVADKGWTNATLYAELVMDSNITVTTSGTPVGDWGLNTGKYYTKDLTWRIYQNESPSIVVKAAEGKTIVSVKITYLIDKTGILTLNGSNITSGTVVDVNANSVTFSVGNTGTATNGQVKITAIEVIYA